MEITKELVERLAKLARLDLNEKETVSMQKDLSEILAYVDSLNEVDISGIEPTSRSIIQENVFRADEPRKEDYFAREDIIKQAPARDGDYFKVKEIFT